MKKKLICAFLSIILTITLTSCSFTGELLGLYALFAENYIEENQERNSEKPSESSEGPISSKESESNESLSDVEDYDFDNISDKYPYKQCRFGYESLEEGREQTLYQYIEYAAYHIESKKDESGNYPIALIKDDTSVDKVQFMKVMTAFQNDNPHIFWLTNNFEYFDMGSLRYFQMYSNVSADECEAMQKEFYLAVKKIISNIPDGAEEYEREIFLHDYIVENCYYNEDDLWMRYSPYGALIQNGAVCEGYSEAFQLLLNCAGIESTVAVGTSDGEAHEWNIVKIDGNWYYLDITWNDSDQSIEDELDQYYYFNVNDKFMKKSGHVLSPLYKDMTPEQIANAGGEYMEQFNLYLPDCKSMAANFYYRNAATVTDPERLEKGVLDKLIGAMQNKAPYFYMRSREKIGPDNIFQTLFASDTYYQYIDAANASGKTSGHQVKNDGVRTYTLNGYDDLMIAQLDYLS